jgi:hypothetical protein
MIDLLLDRQMKKTGTDACTALDSSAIAACTEETEIQIDLNYSYDYILLDAYEENDSDWDGTPNEGISNPPLNKVALQLPKLKRLMSANNGTL